MAEVSQDNHFIEHKTGVYHYKIVGRGTTGDQGSQSKENFTEWKNQTLNVGNYKVIPYGDNNDIPQQIQEVFLPNHLAPGVQHRKIELLIEQGPYLYEEVADGKKLFRKPIERPDIIERLIEMNYEDLFEHNATEYYYGQIIYNRMIRNRASRLGPGAISEILPESSMNCRLAFLSTAKQEIPTHVIIGDWASGGNESDYEVLPIYDPKNPTRYPQSIHISTLKTFGVPVYNLPDTYGALNWIKRSTSTPRIIEALIDNSLNIKWHIQSPSSYWEKVKTELMKKATAAGKTYKDNDLKVEQDRIFKELTEILSGETNQGKFWHNQYVVELIGGQAKEMGWRIEAIDQKIGDYVKSHLEISTKSDFAVIAALRLHSALANVGANGKSDSGSEQLYALKIHQLTSTGLAERKVCKSVNDFLRVNYPNEQLKIGFYHINAEREQDLTESKRVTTQTPL